MSGTSASPSDGVSPRPRRVSVGSLVALIAVVIMVAIAWRMFYLVHTRTTTAIGDGLNVESYRFDLSNLLVPRETLAASGLPKNGLRSLDTPPAMPPEAADAFNHENRFKYLVPDDRVIGVALGGRARAYPLRVLTWHEVANDTLSSRSIAVTYSPLCDSAVVFDRVVEGETLEFGFSGLLYNSNLVMYDRRPEGRGESLWSQLRFRAISGPAGKRGQTLTVIPCSVVRWENWRQLHPDTDVISPDPFNMGKYNSDPYANYYGSPEQLRFAVFPLPPKQAGLEWKTPVVVVEANGARRVIPVPVAARKAGSAGTWTLPFNRETLGFQYYESPPTVAVTVASSGESAAVAYAFWFACYSMNPGDRELLAE